MRLAVLRAGKRLLKIKPNRLLTMKDFLTDADFVAELETRQLLAESFPEIPFFGEESGEVIDPNASQWVVDPIDGTVNYAHGDDHWGVSIALVEKGQSMSGVVYLPKKDELFSVCRDSLSLRMHVDEYSKVGASVSFCVNKETLADKPLVLVEWTKELHGGKDGQRVLEIVSQLVGAGFLYPQIRNATTASLMMVAQGKAGGFVHLRPEPFDIAAGCLILERAGGKVTNLVGEPWSPFSAEKGIIASNGIIHEELLAAIAMVA